MFKPNIVNIPNLSGISKLRKAGAGGDLCCEFLDGLDDVYC